MKNLLLVLQILNDPLVKEFLEGIINFIKEMTDGIPKEEKHQKTTQK